MEAQRLFSVAPVAVPHRTMKDCDVLGHKIPKVGIKIYPRRSKVNLKNLRTPLCC